jgi:hypothetical protein
MNRELPVLSKYSRHSLMVANATGVLKFLKEQEQQPFHSPAWWQLHQRILTRLFLISTQIESIAAELDCEGERADQIAEFMTQSENQKVKRLTIASIVSGAVGGIGNAVLSSHAASVTAAVVGGSLSAALGLRALFSERKVSYLHSRNLLRDIWIQPSTSAIYPPSIWYMLSNKFFSNEQLFPIAVNMKNRWIAFEAIKPHNKKSDERVELLFGSGGKYSADDLRARSRMLNQVQASVKLMNQDLQELVEDISK